MSERHTGLETNRSAMPCSRQLRPAPPHPRPRRAALLWVSLILLGGSRAMAAPSGEETFASPQAAAAALASAWHIDKVEPLLKIYGPGGRNLVTSGDPVAERTTRERFAAAYDQQHRIEQQGPDEAILVIGKEDFPYPIPIVRAGSAWRFDLKAGLEQVLDRRIGANEMHAIDVSRAYVMAQREFAADRRQAGQAAEYAQQLASSANKRDGLYWPVKPGEKQSPIGPLVAVAETNGYGLPPASAGDPHAFEGYYFRILNGQGAHAPGGARSYVANGRMTGGFALVAFPSRWGDSGVMTFLVNQNGIVFQKDLGPDTIRLARQITLYDPDRTWRIVYSAPPRR
jgi:Protein of unknown function (DUF2950)